MNSPEDHLQDDEEKTTRIFSAAARQDIEELKSLLNSPKWYTVENESGYSLLETVIMHENTIVFDFLLSIEDFCLDSANSERAKRRSSLLFSLSECNDEINEDLSEYYAIELIKKGADVHVIDVTNNTLLHIAVESEYLEVCRLLIEKGVDVNAQNYWGDTPLQILFDGAVRTHEQTLLKFLYMFLYYNADLSPPNKRSLNVDIFEFSLLMEVEDDWIGEILFNYMVDEYSDCEVDAAVFFYFMSERKNDALTYKIINHVNDMKAQRLVDCAVELFLINSNYMKALLNKFDYFIAEVFCYCLTYNIKITEFYFNTESLATFSVLLESDFRDDVVKCINYLGIGRIIKGYFDYQKCDNSTATIKELIYYLLPYFNVVSSCDLNVVYRKFGYCDLFKVLLHMEIDVDETLYDVMPGIIFDVHFDLEEYLYDRVPYEASEDTFDGKKRSAKDFYHGCTAKGVEMLLEYFADETIKDFCFEQDNEKLTVKAMLLPQVPLLQQLARDSCRKFLVEKYNITNSRQFYTILNWLPISPVHKKIISYETPLY